MSYTSIRWPGQDPLDGWTELPLSPAVMTAYWDTDIIDTSGIPSTKIIRVTDSFDVWFRVELAGTIWKCMTGTWEFDIGFTAIGSGSNFDLSSLVPNLTDPDWKGCDRLWVEKKVTVPPNTIPINGRGTVYELAAKFFLVCCDGHVAATGAEALEEYEFYKP
ncbi:MAG: hypothetical protein H6531_08405 [Actinobacteria bacterium]|nr:hypothetical protein [Thermoleophilia bacterium]MCB9011836.1 hypothetical protein [Actinomycetota bacterium]